MPQRKKKVNIDARHYLTALQTTVHRAMHSGKLLIVDYRAYGFLVASTAPWLLPGLLGSRQAAGSVISVQTGTARLRTVGTPGATRPTADNLNPD